MSAYLTDNIFVLLQQQAAILGATDEELSKAQTEVALQRLIVAYTAAIFSIAPVADGTYTVGIGGTTNGTITTVRGIITSVQEAA